MRYFIPLLLSLVGCFGLHSVALRLLGGGVDKGESNYFSSLARMQHAANGEATVFLLGSSRTGRLPDRRWAPQEFPEVANLGCDGGSALVALRAIDEGNLPCPPVVVIEGNTLVHDLEGRGDLVAGQIGSPWFELGVFCPQMRSDARPASLVYSLIRDRRFRSLGGSGISVARDDLESRIEKDARVLPAAAEALVDDLQGIAERLRERGTKLLLVMLPPAADGTSLNTRLPLEWSHRSRIPWVDLGHSPPDGGWSYTDSVHLSPESARLALQLIKGVIDEAS